MATTALSKPLTLAEAAAELGCSVDTLRRWYRLGKIKVFRAPGGIRVSVEEVDRLLRGGPMEVTDGH